MLEQSVAASALRVYEARVFAVRAHGEQKYGESDLPYSHHLDAVAKLLEPYGDEAMIVGYLHDVAEDTDVHLTTIRTVFGERVACLVSLVTDEEGPNRRERKAKTNAKLAAVGKEDELALIVKAADRLANLRESAKNQGGSKLVMYRREHPEFYKAVYRPGLCDVFWREMIMILDG